LGQTKLQIELIAWIPWETFQKAFTELFLQVLQSGEGILVVVRQPDHHRHASEYLPCEYCLGFYSRDTLYKHVKDCTCRNASDVKEKSAVTQGLMLVTPLVKADCQPEMRELLRGMRETVKNPGMVIHDLMSEEYSTKMCNSDNIKKPPA
jgi:hypothetical protein